MSEFDKFFDAMRNNPGTEITDRFQKRCLLVEENVWADKPTKYRLLGTVFESKGRFHSMSSLTAVELPYFNDYLLATNSPSEDDLLVAGQLHKGTDFFDVAHKYAGVRAGPLSFSPDRIESSYYIDVEYEGNLNNNLGWIRENFYAQLDWLKTFKPKSITHNGIHVCVQSLIPSSPSISDFLDKLFLNKDYEFTTSKSFFHENREWLRDGLLVLK